MSMLFKRIKDWATSITAFRNGDVIPVDGPDGTAKMGKDDLLLATAQNALAGNIAPEFDPTRTEDDKYEVNQEVIYGDKLFIFTAPHYGVWNPSHVKRSVAVQHSTISEIEQSLYSYDEVTLELDLSNGYLKTDGTISGSSDWRYTEAYIKVKRGEHFKATTLTYNTVLTFAAYNDSKVLLADKSLSKPLEEQTPYDVNYVVPSGVSYIRISLHKSGTVVKRIDKSDKIERLQSDSANHEFEINQMKMLSSLEEIGSFGLDPDEPDYKNVAESNGTWLTLTNSDSSVSGILSEVFIDNINQGTIQFATGILDQNGIFIPSKKFSIYTSENGRHSVIPSEPVFIYAGEQLFVNRYTKEGKLAVGRTEISQNAYRCNLVYNLAEGTSGETYPEQLGYISTVLVYKVCSINSVFALKNELDSANEEIEILKQNQFVFDSNGDAYKLRVDDFGNVYSVPLTYSNVVILGNSLTWHEYWGGNGGNIDVANWAGLNRSMASTTDDVSWPKLFEKILKKKSPNAVVKGVMMRNWETAGDGNRNIENIPSTKALLDSALTADTDLIIFRCGENGSVSDSDVYADEIKALIDYCLSTATRANVVMTTLFWPNAVKDDAIAKVARDTHYQLVHSGRRFSGYTEHYGDFHVDSLNVNSYVLLKRDVVSHTADHGFYLWTNYLAGQLGYERFVLDELYEVIVTSQNPFYIKDDKSVGGSLVTVLTYGLNQPSCTVTDSDGNSVAFRVLDISGANIADNVGTYTFAICFIQPDSNVNVSIS